VSDEKLKLPDVSFWQDDPTTADPINFGLMSTKTPAAIIRAGQGTVKDRVFDTSWKNAKLAGMRRGSYWFYDSRVHPQRQAEKYAEVLGDDTGEMEAWCDFEDRYGGPYGGWEKWYVFMANLEQLLPEKKLGVYTGYYYWNEFAHDVKWFGKFPLWIAWYNYPYQPLVPSVWKTWDYWQYTDDYPSYGWGVQSKEIDMNFFNGTAEEFFARYHIQGETNKATELVAKIGDQTALYKKREG
jgi:lysozyme